MSADRDRGAVMVEGAIAMVFLAVLLVGITEFGFAWRQATLVDKGVQNAGRAAGNMADQPTADYESLQSLRVLLAGAKNLTLDYVVIYKSATADGSPPSACLTAAVPGLCNRYVATDLGRPASDFGTCTGSAPDRFWCPTTRVRDRAPTADYVGVQVRLRYRGLSGAIPGAGITIDRRAVYSLEPCAFGLPGC